MKKRVHFFKLSFILAAMVAFSINFSACNGDDEPEPDTTGNNNNNNGGGTAQGDYILFDGYRLEMKNPAKGTLIANGFDTSLSWSGNQPAGIDGDTNLYISHESRIAKTYSKIVEGANASDEVGIQIEWGTSAGKPLVNILSGTYKLERVNGFWVSTLTNGSGEWDKGGGDVETFNNIEFRATWPD